MEQRPYNEGRLSEAFYNGIANSCDERILDAAKEKQDIFETAEQIARSILQGANDILSKKSVIDAQIAIYKLLESPINPQNEKLCEQAIKAVDEQLGKFVVQMQATAENRFLTLVEIGQSTLLDDKTSEYLRRVSQCYLFGLDEQCLIMCRSALEAAFLQAAPDSDCEKDLKVRKEPRQGHCRAEYFLSDRINAIQNKDIKNKTFCKTARDVNEEANDMLHPNRERKTDITQKTMDEILIKTVHVIKELAEM